MRSLMSQATLMDLLIGFGVGALAGFLYAYVDVYGISKIETAVGVPAGSF